MLFSIGFTWQVGHMVQCVRSDYSPCPYDKMAQVSKCGEKKRNLLHVCMSTTHMALDIQNTVGEIQNILGNLVHNCVGSQKENICHAGNTAYISLQREKLNTILLLHSYIPQSLFHIPMCPQMPAFLHHLLHLHSLPSS